MDFIWSVCMEYELMDLICHVCMTWVIQSQINPGVLWLGKKIGSFIVCSCQIVFFYVPSSLCLGMKIHTGYLVIGDHLCCYFSGGNDAREARIWTPEWTPSYIGWGRATCWNYWCSPDASPRDPWRSAKTCGMPSTPLSFCNSYLLLDHLEESRPE